MVAQMRPPSLKAIIAWEGWSDGTPPPPLRLSPSPQLLRAVYFQQGCVKFSENKGADLYIAYRDIWFQGGIPETSFAPGWLKGIQNGRNETEDLIRLTKEHPLLDDLWKIREVDLKAIDVPAFIVRPHPSWRVLMVGC